MEEEDTNEIIVESENENVVELNEVKPKKQRKQFTPEYKALLVERIAHARKVKRQAHDAGVTPKRVIMPDSDQKKPFFCDVCKKTYASKTSLNNHNKRYHSEKQLMNIIKEKEKKTDNIKVVTGKEAPPPAPVAPPPPPPAAAPAPPPPPPPAAAPAPAPVPPPEMKPISSGPARYTYDEYKLMETQNNIKKKLKENEAKAQAKQAHIQRTIDNMRAGGIPTFHY